MNTLVSRLAVTCIAATMILAAASGPAAAKRSPGPDPLSATPTPAPLYAIGSPPPTVNNPKAIDACANDAFLADRTVPMPLQREVTICGLATDGASASPPAGRAASFYVDVDGTQPIAVTADGPAVSVRPGDIIVVRGRYHRDNGGGEGIDSVHASPGRGWPYDGYVIVNGQMIR